MEDAIQKTPEQIVKEDEERFAKIVEEEKKAILEARKTALIADEALPPIIKDDGFGTVIAHVIIDGEYMPEPMASVKIQEKKLVMEYYQLEKLKEVADKYLSSRKKAKKLNN